MDYFENYKPEIILDTVQLLQRENHEKRAEYERKKAELEKMKAEYGFEDWSWKNKLREAAILPRLFSLQNSVSACNGLWKGRNVTES